MIFYVAHPMDYSTEGVAESIALVSEALAGLGSLFIPRNAWSGAGSSPQQQQANEGVIRTCNALIAIWDGQQKTVGVHREIGYAKALGIPVCIVGAPSEGAAHAGEFHTIDPKRLRGWAVNIGQLSQGPRNRVGYYTGDDPLRQAYPGDAGFDLHVASDTIVHVGRWVNVPCRTRIKLPDGYWGLIVGRSSTFWKMGLITNPGIIDNGYTGELFVSVHNPTGQETDQIIKKGERIAQLIPLPCSADRVEWLPTDILPVTARGDNGFGSSGR